MTVDKSTVLFGCHAFDFHFKHFNIAIARVRLSFYLFFSQYWNITENPLLLGQP